MRPILRKVNSNAEHSFSVREDIFPFLYNYWHYHPEAELTYIRKSTGTRLVGDNIEPFADGDLVLLGANLPHLWRNDEVYFQDKGFRIEAIAIHFYEDFWGTDFLEMPENAHIRDLLIEARRGLKIFGSTHRIISSKMEEILGLKGVRRVVQLYEMLDIIARSSEKEMLCSAGFLEEYTIDPNDKINEIYQYALANFKNGISIEEIAEHVHVSPNYFCRYFKKRTSKTFIEFITELRVGHACKLLIEGTMNISQICFESGFNNLPNFNRKFKELVGKSPTQYCRDFSKRNGSSFLHPVAAEDLRSLQNRDLLGRHTGKRAYQFS
ncbi:helix-turn-helix domain-containing protein [Marinilongibacter aquaticus]|uniref:AraC family transcriptional regulator n=1 Tax=Marinilongibacter aquaticus TaxID=2975157 RepID=UPI0021BD4161|nr:helix-turn-helix domain-containing protein [Marinilongibacter aquaticus]UBM57177.1 helix-turn-helix domain-containing protein [Marinilongibacter aquaticus]